MKQVVTYGLLVSAVALGFAGLAFNQAKHARLAAPKPVADAAVEAIVAAPQLRALKFKLFELSGGDIVLEGKFRKTLPASIHTTKNTAERKALFINSLLPIILRNNDAILAVRTRLLALKDTDISAKDQKWLRKLADQYRVDSTSIKGTALSSALLQRVDIIPPSLALSQAIMESGWGTSRFARLGNALFGQWIWGDGEGIVPENRAAGTTHRIKAYKTIAESVADYMRNLNRHIAYKDLRARRAELREHDLAVTGEMLAPGLSGYSERGEEYVAQILSIITYNDLAITDLARLARPEELK